MADLYANVALDLAVDQTFTYRVPPALRESVVPGRRVRVPFRKRSAIGYCVELSDSTDLRRVLDIQSVMDDDPLIWAMKDPVSRATGVIVAALIAAAVLL